MRHLREASFYTSLVELAGNKYDLIFIGNHSKQSLSLVYTNDMCQLDTDKGGYLNYFDLIMEHDLLTDQGIILADNGTYNKNFTEACILNKFFYSHQYYSLDASTNKRMVTK